MIEYIKIIANELANINLIDTKPTTASSENNLTNVQSGGRYLKYSSTSNPLEIAYINKTNKLSANCFVATDFDQHLARSVTLKEYSSYSGSSSNIYTNSSFNEELYGHNDWLYEFSPSTDVEAFSVVFGGVYDKKIGKLFWGNSVDFEYVSSTDFAPVVESVVIDREIYHVNQTINLLLVHSAQSEIKKIEDLVLTKRPYFLYDTSGEHLYDKLWYVVSPTLPVIQRYDDSYTINLTAYRIRW